MRNQYTKDHIEKSVFANPGIASFVLMSVLSFSPSLYASSLNLDYNETIMKLSDVHRSEHQPNHLLFTKHKKMDNYTVKSTYGSTVVALNGLYVGDPSIWGEQITFNFMVGGAMHIISDNEQPVPSNCQNQSPLPAGCFPHTEFSSQGTGIWTRTGPRSLEFAYREHRFGDYLCGTSVASPDPDGDPPVIVKPEDLTKENCLLIGYGTLTINPDNTVSMTIGLKVRDRVYEGVPRDDSYNKNIGPFDGLPLTKISIDDMVAQ